MKIFCTYCDHGYAARMRCLHASLRAQGEPFRLLVLCFDAATEAAVAEARDASLEAIPLAALLAADPAYAVVRSARSRIEFYFTATPVLVRHCFEREPDAADVTYLDADLFFFRPTSDVFAEQGAASVGIVPHRFPARLADRASHGIFNVGWVSFRRDEAGLACLAWWRERCLEWCYDRLESGRFADQGYLDEFPRRFRGVKSLEHPGINAAPWNLEPEAFAVRGGAPWLQEKPVMFFHYQGIREVAPGWFDPGLGGYGVRLTRSVRDGLFLPYLRQLVAFQDELQRQVGILPVRGYLRMPIDGSWGARWERFRAGRFMTTLRYWRGKLVHCPYPNA